MSSARRVSRVSAARQGGRRSAENFRTTVTIAVEAANRAHKGEPSPVMAEMTRKITEALNA